MSITESSQPDQILNAAITAIRAGETERGRVLLAQVLRANPSCESAWLWMATIAETPQQKHECLERALAINPQNSIARRRLQSLGVTALPVARVRTQHAASPAASAPSTLADAACCPNCSAEIDTADQRCRFCGSQLHTLPRSPASRLRSSLDCSQRSSLPWSDRYNLIKRANRLSTFSTSGYVAGSFFVLLFLFPLVLFSIPNDKTRGIVFLVLFVSTPFILFLVWIIEKSRPQKGLTAEAKVIDLWAEDEEEREYWGEPYFIAWELQLPTQKGEIARFRKAQQLNAKQYARLHRRDTVIVRYDPERPERSALDAQWLAELEK
ncbi:MAG: DUF3592 domain-containing protein [Roseiflexus sp.]|nr:DUF3592 domain-containing protein [Roseiflexus sp.]MCS7289144.1 DUF3592 domain-containing protein [Roseiflexus sp.]